MAAGTTLQPQDLPPGVQAPAMVNPIEGVDTPPPAVAAGAPAIATASGAGGATPGTVLTPPVQGPAAGVPAPAAPAAANPIAAPTAPNGKPMLQTGPPQPPKFDTEKLAKANTTLDLLNAMTPKSRNGYMNWWEQTHGDINQRYDNMQAQLGARPATNQPYSKKEKFAALLEFGLHLMKASATPSFNQGAVLAGAMANSADSMQAEHAKNIAAEQSKYDSQQNAIEHAREADQRELGSPLRAGELDVQANKTAIGAPLETANALKTGEAALGFTAPPDNGKFTYITDNQNHIFAVGRGADGKPVKYPLNMTGRVLGTSTGSGADKQTPQQRNYSFLTGSLHIDPNTASQIAFRVRSGNPAQDHLSVYNSVLRATMGDTAAAQQAADNYVASSYGQQALAGLHQPIVTQAPPPGALAGLKPGMVRRFRDGTAWTVGPNGQPQRVSPTPQPVLR